MLNGLPAEKGCRASKSHISSRVMNFAFAFMAGTLAFLVRDFKSEGDAEGDASRGIVRGSGSWQRRG